MRYISYKKKSWHKYKVVLIYKYTTVEILKKQMIFLGGDTMDEEILVILIAYVIMPIIICTICLIVEIIRNKKKKWGEQKLFRRSFTSLAINTLYVISYSTTIT